MGLVLKVLSWFYFIYPIKVFIRGRVVDYFLYYHVRKILVNAGNSRVYVNDFRLESLVYRRAFRGIIFSYFKANNFIPTAKDLAIAISISTESYKSESRTNVENIIDLSYHLTNRIKEAITFDLTLKTIFEELGLSLAELNNDVERKDIVEVFQSKKLLFSHYFKSFHNPHFSYGIKIWHENECDNWVSWNETESLTINLDPLAIREGFFLQGFDYSEIDSGDSLHVATTKGGYEYFNTLKSDNIVWAR
ncbi:hypothetical protein C4G47_RS23505 [Vibrio parahaemolyticus O1]|nr:hypothetical protein [Vibrio parahaemolyticus O1]